jgi:hypothetical protein
MFQDWNGHFDLFILNNGTRLQPLQPWRDIQSVQHTTKHLGSQNIEKKFKTQLHKETENTK